MFETIATSLKRPAAIVYSITPTAISKPFLGRLILGISD